MEKKLYKIKSRSAHDYVEIWPFESFMGALHFCLVNKYIGLVEYQEAIKDKHHSLVVSFIPKDVR